MPHGVAEVVEVEQALVGLQVAWIDVAGHLPLVDARIVMREEGCVALIVVDAGWAQND